MKSLIIILSFIFLTLSIIACKDGGNTNSTTNKITTNKTVDSISNNGDQFLGTWKNYDEFPGRALTVKIRKDRSVIICEGTTGGGVTPMPTLVLPTPMLYDKNTGTLSADGLRVFITNDYKNIYIGYLMYSKVEGPTNLQIKNKK